jgi:hypothetical protein
MTFIARFIGGLLSRILAVALAVTAMQLPLYYAQYLQTLAGARQEAALRYDALVREAGALQLSAQDFIIRHESNGDPVFQASGRLHRATLDRFQKLDAAWQALSSATAIDKPRALAQHFDRQLAEAVDFKPSVPLSLEGAAYALAGIVLAWLVSSLFGLVLLPRRKAAPPKPALPPAPARSAPVI